jgi:outer membrane receptor protein involved in Fe transport
MKFLRIALLLFLLIQISSVEAQSQQSSQVTGIVVDETGTPLAYVSVALQDTASNEIFTGSVSAEDGSFSISYRPGTYQLRFTFLSYERVEKMVTLTRGEQQNIGTVLMKPSSQNIDEVEIRAERSQMEMKFDKRVFSVGSDITSIGGSASEVLDNLPSVTSDIDGNISLRGSGNVRLLINGKPTNAAGDTGDELQSIPANLIDRVEVITNPSARYDAEGEAGIINIILKKNERRGVNGSVDVSTGYPHNHEAAINLNYRTGSVNWFGSINGEYRARPGDGFTIQRYNGPDTTYSYRQDRESDRSGLEGEVRLGADIFLPANQKLTFQLQSELEDGLNKQTLIYRDFDADQNLIERTNRKDREEENESELEFEISYLKEFDDFKEHKLTSDIQFEMEDETEKSDISEIEDLSGNELFQRSDNQEKTANGMWQIDYVHPFSEDFIFETGAKTTFRIIENNYRVEEEQGGAFVTLENLDENFTYTENIAAAYLIQSADFEKWSYQLGLRGEYTDVTTELNDTGDKGENNYWDLFPSAFLTYKIDDINSVQASYSRRLSRPWYRLILPFSNFTDNRNRYTGNPDLDPIFTNSYELGYLSYWDKGSFMGNLYIRDSEGIIERITTVSDDGEYTIRIPVNLAEEFSYGIEFNGSVDVTQNLSFNGSLNFFNSEKNGSYNGQDLSSETSSYFGRMRAQYRKDGWTVQASGFHRGEQETTQGIRKPFTTANLAIGKQLWDRKATISLNVRDVFNTRKRRGIIDEEFLYQESEFRWSSRSITLGFTYRFNQDNNRQQRRGQGRNGGGMDEGMDDID